jgi:acyl-CoA thioesterase FadM
MSWSAIYFFKKVILTKTMTVDFLKPVLIGEALQIQGRIQEQISEREAVMEAKLLNPAGEICSRSRAVFALISPELSLKMGILDETGLKNFEPLIGPV